MDHRRTHATARAQHGLVTRAQVLHLGGSDQIIRTLVSSGRWERIRRGVFAVGAVADTWERRVMAACLAAGPGAVASHRTAARLWGLVDRSGPVQLLVADDRRVRLHGVEVRRSALLPRLDTTRERNIPVCTPARAIVDLSSHQTPETIGAWVDQCLRAGSLHLLDLRTCVARLAGPGRPSLAHVHEVLAKRLPGYDPGDSDLEVRAMTILREAGLPDPVPQHPVVRPGGQMAFIDLAYPAQLVGIELDGWEYHGQRGAFDRDRDRRNDLTLLGWRMFQFTSSTTAPMLAATVGRALGLGAPPGQ